MKLFKRLGFLFAGLGIVSATSVLTITSCAKTNPYQDKKTGDEISISSKKDKDNCDSVAKERIKPYPPGTPTNNLKLLLTGSEEKTPNSNSFASSQIYWELVHYMCSSYSVGTSSIKIEGNSSEDGRFVFIEYKNDDPINVGFSAGSSVTLISSSKNITYASATLVHYAAPIQGFSHFTLNIGDDPYESYALFALNNN